MGELVIVKYDGYYIVTRRKSLEDFEYLEDLVGSYNSFTFIHFEHTFEEQFRRHQTLSRIFEIDHYIIEHEEEFKELFTKEKVKAML